MWLRWWREVRRRDALVMDTGTVKLWHVALALPLVTAGIVGAWLSVEPDTSRTTAPTMFERAARQPPAGKEKKQPMVFDVTLYPPVEGRWIVEFSQLTPDWQKNTWTVAKWSFAGKTPYERSEETIPEWLDRMKREINGGGGAGSFDYRYAWWRDGQTMWRGWGVLTGACAVWLVGSAALGVMKMRGEPRRVSRGAERAVAAAPAPDSEELDDLINRYEASTASSEEAGTRGAAGHGGGSGPAPVPVLKNEPVEAAAVPERAEESKEYKGEFYPVVRPGGHKEGEAKE